MFYNPIIHQRRSIRLREYDYSRIGLYFVTICVQNHECLFGKIDDEKMVLSPLGIIANVIWYEIKNHAKNVELHEFVVMPNHIHVIIEITNDYDLPTATITATIDTDIDTDTDTVGARHALPLQSPTQPTVQMAAQPTVQTTMQLPPQTQPPHSRFQNQGKNTLSSIVGSYKSAVSKHAHRLGFDFAWQRNYWEHIIRDDDKHEIITKYIENNPILWETDRFYK